MKGGLNKRNHEEKDRGRACRLLLPLKQVVMCFGAANQKPTIAPRFRIEVHKRNDVTSLSKSALRCV